MIYVAAVPRLSTRLKELLQEQTARSGAWTRLCGRGPCARPRYETPDSLRLRLLSYGSGRTRTHPAFFQSRDGLESGSELRAFSGQRPAGNGDFGFRFDNC